MELKAKLRTELGKKTNALRMAGFLPAVVYGEGIESQPISVLSKDFGKVYKAAGESTLITLDVSGKQYNVLIHDIASDPLKGHPLHADFYAVRMDKAIRTKVSLEFLGESQAVKNEGGILIKVAQELEVEALAQDLPHELRVDLSSLVALGSKVLVRDISLPKGVKVVAGPDDIVVVVEAPRTEEELADLKEAPVAEISTEIKTEREIKQELKGKEAGTEVEKAVGKETGKKG